MLGSKGKVKLDPDLLDRARKAAETAGYSSVEEFLNHLVEKELKKIETATTEARDEDELKERLKGLGYIS